jgi:signal transduction histidine kinase
MTLIMATTTEYFSLTKTFLKGLLYCLTAAASLASAYFALTLINQALNPGQELSVNNYLTSGATILTTLIFVAILARLTKLLVRRLDSDGYNETEILRKMSQITVQNHGVKDFFSAIRHTLDKSFGVERVDIVIFDQDTAVHMDDRRLESVLIRIVSDKDKNLHTIYREEIKKSVDHTTILAHNIEVITPIIGTINNNNNNNKIIGVLLLTPRARRFSRFYGDTLEKVSAILSPFIQSAVFYEQINGFNTKLKVQIAEKTKKLRESNTELKHIDEVKDDMLSIASHQLRTPLTGILGYSDMLHDGDFGKIAEGQKPILAQIIKSANDMNSMLLDYLDVTRIDTGRFELHEETFNLSDLASGEVEKMRDMAHEFGRQIIYKADSEPIEFTGDETRLRQVITNFIDNAIYYGKDKITVDLHRIGKNIVFTVKDDGIGVKREDQPRLFGKMFRADNAKNVRPDGSGIGLYVAKSIIEASGGTLIFDSTEGKGSVFGFKI